MLMPSRLLLLLLTFLAPQMNGSDISVAIDAVDGVAKQYREMVRQQTLEAIQGEIAETDAALAQCMTDILARNHSMKELEIAMGGRIVLKPFPTLMTMESRQQEVTDAGLENWMMFRAKAVDDKTDIYVLEPSLGPGAKGRLRFSPSLIAVIARGAAAKYVYLDGPTTSRLSELRVSYLGFIDRGNSFLPDIALLNGPSGSGSFGSLELCRWNPKRDAWDKQQIAEWTGFSSFSFNATDGILSYSCEQDGATVDAKINLREASATIKP